MKRFRIPVVAAMVVAMLGGTMAIVQAQIVSDAVNALPVKTSTYVYAAKFLCGEFDKYADPNQPAIMEGPVKPGNYQTIVNVHNPQFSTVKLQKKALMLFAGERPTEEIGRPQGPGELQPFELKSDWGVYIACTEIRRELLDKAPAAPAFIEGWLVIYSPSPIDVESVVTSYTYNRTFEGPAAGMFVREGFDTEMERVQPTRVSNYIYDRGEQP